MLGLKPELDQARIEILGKEDIEETISLIRAAKEYYA